MRQPVQVAVVIARRSELCWEYLLLRRVQQGGGFWQYVTGGVEDNESRLQAALRELHEETGFELTRLMPVDYIHSFPVPASMKELYVDEVAELIEYSFLGTVKEDAEPLINRKEHDEYRWCSFDEALSLLYWKANKDVLKLCFETLKSRF